MARRLLVVAAVLGLLAAVPASLAATPRVVQASGDVARLSPTKIKVGGLVCSIERGRLRIVARALVVGQPVKIACRNGVLSRVWHVPATLPSVTKTPAPSLPTVPNPASYDPTDWVR
jgi:hypothetical protein